MLRARVLVAGLALLLVPAGACAATTLKITGHKQVVTDHSTTIRVSGQTGQPRALAIYFDSKACPRGVGVEAVRITAGLEVAKTVHGPFRHSIKILHSSAGSHYVCAYVYILRHGNLTTDARASLHYVTS